MLDVTTFITRWLYVCNLVRDVAEIQTLPYTPLLQQHPHHYNQQHIPPPIHPAPPPQQQHPTHAALHRQHLEDEWNDQCLRGILSYPPGMQRLYALDAIRMELVQKLARRLKGSDDVLHRYAASCRQRTPVSLIEEEEEDPYLDADVEIVRAFEEATSNQVSKENEEEEEAVLVISRNGTNLMNGDDSGETKRSDTPELQDIPSPAELKDAYQTTTDLTDYLPQLVSAVLKSPPAFQPQLLDPMLKLRRLLLTRCLQDANWGIELCWLLEADVGRAWKTLFEHRQQTGKRLIVVLPAEKAAVLAKIGTEKREAFDLLQDAEQATAYGYTFPSEYHSAPLDSSDVLEPPKLPSSLSLRRCSHFGDTMHFIDRLTQVSNDLKVIPTIQRHDYLMESLAEMNRRLRRRMVTRGDVSLDVEDNRGPHDWPTLSDMSADVLKYSVHFPLDPKRVTWPGGLNDEGIGTIEEKTNAGVMRVLNIATPECRILASRERCPFLVQLEVAESGLEGSDARLYACGAHGIGATVEESLGMNPGAASSAAAANHHRQPYQIPSELLASPLDEERLQRIAKRASRDEDESDSSDKDKASEVKSSSGNVNPPRGGWQSDEGMFFPAESADYLYSNPYDMVRQQEYEQLHQQLQPHPPYQPPQHTHERRTYTTKSALLERVFGLPWNVKCEQIRQTSPYGNVKGWRLASFIIKAGEDIRREALVMQIISKMNEWFTSDIPERHRPHLRPYTIMCVGGDAGLIECLSDAKSIDEVKKKTDGFISLRDYFERAYGPPSRPLMPPNPNAPPFSSQQSGEISFDQAQDNFLRSLVGYSLICYILQIKDRHNANILLDREGHIMHIDFGFVLGDMPKMAKMPIFSERAPFKLSTEFWEVLGGWNFSQGGLGVKFCKMFEMAFACAASHVEEIASFVEGAMLNLTLDPESARVLANGIRSRLRMRGPAGSTEQQRFIMELVSTALTSLGTPTYDLLQKYMNGYQ